MLTLDRIIHHSSNLELVGAGMKKQERIAYQHYAYMDEMGDNEEQFYLEDITKPLFYPLTLVQTMVTYFIHKKDFLGYVDEEFFKYIAPLRKRTTFLFKRKKKRRSDTYGDERTYLSKEIELAHIVFKNVTTTHAREISSYFKKNIDKHEHYQYLSTEEDFKLHPYFIVFPEEKKITEVITNKVNVVIYYA